MRKIFTSIDIGSDSIRIVCLEYYHEKYNVLASVIVESAGVKMGLIVDANLVINAIKKGIKKIESRLGTKIDKAIAVIPSNNIELIISTGKIKIDRVDKTINGDDVYRCLGSSLKSAVDKRMEVVSIFPIEYKLDKDQGIKNPLGMTGKDLSVKCVVAMVPNKNILSVVNAIQSLDIEVLDITFSSIGDYYSVKNPDLDSKVVAVVNIGGDKTNLAVFNKGVLIKDAILPYGANAIDNDMAFTYKTDPEQSKIIKELFAVSNRKYADGDEVYDTINRLGESIQINQYRLAELVEARIVDLLKNIKNELNNLTKREIEYIIITGGITTMLGFNAIVEELFVRNANVINLGVIGIRDNKYSSAYGAIRYFVEKLESREKEYTMFSDDKIDEILSTSGVLGKIFDKIFD